LEAQLGLGRNRKALYLGLMKPVLQAAFQELSFHPALEQQSIDALELVAPLAVINVALDGGQSGLQGQGERNEVTTHWS
jgi:hypothetical protein